MFVVFLPVGITGWGMVDASHWSGIDEFPA